MAGTKYPVILTSHMQEAIEGGAWIEVECVEAPEKGGNTHRGGWTQPVSAISPGSRPVTRRCAPVGLCDQPGS